MYLFLWGSFGRRSAISSCWPLARLSFGLNRNLLARALKKCFHRPVIFCFVLFCFSIGTFLSSSNNQGFYCSRKKAVVDVFAISFTWSDNFWSGANLIDLFEFDMTLSEILLIAFVNCIVQLFLLKCNSIIFGVCKTRCNSEECKWYLFSVSS